MIEREHSAERNAKRAFKTTAAIAALLVAASCSTDKKETHDPTTTRATVSSTTRDTTASGVINVVCEPFRTDMGKNDSLTVPIDDVNSLKISTKQPSVPDEVSVIWHHTDRKPGQPDKDIVYGGSTMSVETLSNQPATFRYAPDKEYSITMGYDPGADNYKISALDCDTHNLPANDTVYPPKV